MFQATLASLYLSLLLHMQEPFAFEFSPQTDPSGQAYVVIVANQDASNVTVKITGGSQDISQTFSGLRPGAKKKITWRQSEPNASYQLHISSGAGDTDFSFEVVKAQAAGKVGKFTPLSSRDDIVKDHRAKFKTSFALVQYEFRVFNTDGDIVVEDTITDKPIPANGTFEVTWDHPDEVFMVEVKGSDDVGRSGEYRIVPWSVSIPHEDVNFDTAKWDIKPIEEPKVEDAAILIFHELARLEKAKAAVGGALEVQAKLYVVGYTDTVGKPGDNQKLSDNRARSIAKYFADKGIWCEIHYAGMGEKGLRVQTADNVDEVKNRRALYLLTPYEPGRSYEIPGRWSKLVGDRGMPANFVPPPLPDRLKDYRKENVGRGGAAAAEPEAGGGAGAGSSIASANESQAAGADGGAPTAVEGSPGATAKGCQVVGVVPMGGWASLGMLALVTGVSRRRRRPD